MNDQLKHSLTVTNNTQYHKNPDNTTSPVTELTFMVGHNIIKCWYYHYEKTFILANEIEKYYNNYIPKNHYSNMFLEKIVKVNSNICAPSVMYEQTYGIHINPVHLLKVDYSEVRIWTDHQLHNLYIYNDNKFVNLEDYLQQQYKHLFELHNESKTNTAQTNILTDPAQKNNNKNTCSMEVSFIIGDCPVESSIIKSIYYFDKNTFVHKDSVVPYGALVNNAVYDNVFNFNIRPAHFVTLACGNRINGKYESFIRGQRVCHTAPNGAVLPVFIAINENVTSAIPKIYDLYMSKDNKYYILINSLSSNIVVTPHVVPLKEYLYKLFNFTDNGALETKNQTIVEVGKSAINNILTTINDSFSNCWAIKFNINLCTLNEDVINCVIIGYGNRVISINACNVENDKLIPFTIKNGELLIKKIYINTKDDAFIARIKYRTSTHTYLIYTEPSRIPYIMVDKLGQGLKYIKLIDVLKEKS